MPRVVRCNVHGSHRLYALPVPHTGAQDSRDPVHISRRATVRRAASWPGPNGAGSPSANGGSAPIGRLHACSDTGVRTISRSEIWGTNSATSGAATKNAWRRVPTA